jgi:hypothetical protein
MLAYKCYDVNSKTLKNSTITFSHGTMFGNLAVFREFFFGSGVNKIRTLQAQFHNHILIHSKYYCKVASFFEEKFQCLKFAKLHNCQITSIQGCFVLPVYKAARLQVHKLLTRLEVYNVASSQSC